ncbi:MAG: HD domain-containing protein [Methanosarcinaceae archaeon]|nr:HD domain-containing protein [Methanosarcinaceae archaeon]
MDKKAFPYFKNWFREYIACFASPEPLIQKNIQLKAAHTNRVCKNICMLARAEKLRNKECNLARLIALFHDLGRFEQFSKYRTFNDFKSEDHAVLGVRVLKETGIISTLPVTEQHIIYKAIEYHNRMQIPPDEANEAVIFFSKLIRDADKLDILKLISEAYEEAEIIQNPALELNLPKSSTCSKAIIRDILTNKMAKLSDVKNQNDMNLLRLSWVFDLNFPETFVQLEKQHYLEKIYKRLPKTEEVRRVRAHLKASLKACQSNQKAQAFHVKNFLD